MLFIICIYFIFSPFVSCNKDLDSCDIYMAPSLIPGAGRGIIAGKDFNINEVVEIEPTIMIPDEVVKSTQLNNYVFGSNDPNFHLINFGYGVLYNHRDPKTMQHSWNHHIVRPASYNPLPFCVSTLANFQTLAPIKKGEELFTGYGDSWFAARGISTDLNHTEKQSYSYENIQDLNSLGICMSDVHVAKSSIPGAGRGLFASRNFAKDELVTVAPLLTLPMEIVLSDLSLQHSLLVNYCFSSPNSKIALLPLSSAAMINHLHDYNLRYEWYEWPSNNSTTPNNEKPWEKSPETLLNAHFAPLDIVFYADRDIIKGEELFINYGIEWESYWNDWMNNNHQCLHDVLMELEYSSNPNFSGQCEPFRSFITVPNHFFHSTWFNHNLFEDETSFEL